MLGDLSNGVAAMGAFFGKMGISALGTSIVLIVGGF